MSIAVFGSINMDLVTTVSRLPRPGETLMGRSFVTVPGGKGANQAVGCAKMGATTYMVGRVGGDVFGQALLDSLQAAGVNTSQVLVDQSASSGIATIAVDDSAENNIIVVSGANGNIDERDLDRLATLLSSVKLLLIQLEVPLAMVEAAAKIAHEAGVIVVLDPAPAAGISAELYQYTDIITPNESEAALLVGYQIETVNDAHRAAATLRTRGVGTAIVKLGANGAVVANANGSIHYPALTVTAIDTVAAGDAFNAGLSAALAADESFESAIQQAIAAGAYAVTQPGAQDAMPTLAMLQAWVASHHKPSSSC